MQAPDTFGRLLAAGITSWIGLQTIVNLGAVTGLLPITGRAAAAALLRRHRARRDARRDRRARERRARGERRAGEGEAGPGADAPRPGRRGREGRDRRRRHGRHVFPAVALADRLAEARRRVDVRRVLLRTGGDARAGAGYVFHGSRRRRCGESVSVARARAPFVACVGRAALPAARDRRRRRGGHGRLRQRARGPRGPARARPVVLHEQNAVPGLANRVLARGRASVGDHRSRMQPPASRSGSRVGVTGDPVRAASARCRRRGRRSRPRRGRRSTSMRDRRPSSCSAAARARSTSTETIAGAIDAWPIDATCSCSCSPGPTSSRWWSGAAARRRCACGCALAFLDRMELAYAVADLAVAASGRDEHRRDDRLRGPMILVPYPYATENHQEANARELERAGAAERQPDADLSPDGARRVVSWTSWTTTLAASAMARAARGVGAARRRRAARRARAGGRPMTSTRRRRAASRRSRAHARRGRLGPSDRGGRGRHAEPRPAFLARGIAVTRLRHEGLAGARASSGARRRRVGRSRCRAARHARRRRDLERDRRPRTPSSPRPARRASRSGLGSRRSRPSPPGIGRSRWRARTARPPRPR